jgi:hypothetical protein
MECTTPRRYGFLVRRILKDASTLDIERWEQQDNDGMAIQGAWERVRQSMNGRDDMTKPIISKKINPMLMQRFLGFASGRLRMHLPEWWVRRFEELEYWYPKSLVIPSADVETELVTPKLKAFGDYRFPDAITSVRNEGDLLIAASRDQTFRIPMTLLSETYGGELLVNLTPISDSAFAIAVQPDFPAHYPLVAIDNQSHKQLWSATVFGEDIIVFGGSGPRFRTHWSQMVLDNNGRLIIFGACDHSMYIEGLSSDSGALRFRFSTSY